LAKGRIAEFSPFAAANVFVRSWPPHIIAHMVPWAHISQLPKRHLDRFNCFYTPNPRTLHTDRQTDHATCDICSNRPHLCNACMPCGQKAVILNETKPSRPTLR